MVYLDVTVFDRSGRIVTGLPKADFEIYDEGVPHEVAIFSDSRAPISVGVLIDASLSMTADRIKAALAAAAALGRSLQPQDLCSLASFNSSLHRLANWRP